MEEQRRLFDPDNPPLAFPKDNSKITQIREEIRRRHHAQAEQHNVSKRIGAVFNDRRGRRDYDAARANADSYTEGLNRFRGNS